MSRDIIVAAAQHSWSWSDSLALLSALASIVGVYILAKYTAYTKRLMELTQESLEHARTSGEKALTETQRSNQATERSNEIAELGRRSWLVVTFEPVYISVEHRANQRMTLFSDYKLKLTNVGQIPASGVEIWCSFDSWEPLKASDEVPDEIRPKNNNRLEKGIVIGAGMAYEFKLPRESYQILRATRETLATCYCTITYQDFFGKPRETVACWQRRPGVPADDPQEWMHASPKHNYLR